MATAREEVATERGDPNIFDAEAVNTVDAENDAAQGRTSAIQLRDRIGDLANRQLDTGARVDPGDRHVARAPADPRNQPRDDPADRRSARIVIERNPRDASSRHARPQPERLVRRVEVVL